MKDWKQGRERGAGPSQEFKASGISPLHRQLGGQFPVPSILLPTSSCPEGPSCLLNPGMLHIATPTLGAGPRTGCCWLLDSFHAYPLEAETSRPGPMQTGGS